MKDSDFVIFKSHDDWVIKRVGAEYEQHSHFHSRQGCVRVQECVVKGIMPEQEYFRTAAKRLLSSDEFDRLIVKEHQSYYNKNAKQFGRRTG